ncbi:MAG: Hsp20/alpha crystallin family protein [Bacillota bacterium]
MSDLMRWSPFGELQNLRNELNRVFADSFSRLPFTGTEGTYQWAPAINVSETDNEIIVEAEMPGVKQDNINISVTKQSLRISGEVASFTEEREGANFVRRERRTGRFDRSFTLPAAIDPDNVKATYRHGVLHIVLPKAEDVKPRSVKLDIQ